MSLNRTNTVVTPNTPHRKTFQSDRVNLSYLEWKRDTPMDTTALDSDSLSSPVLLLHGLADHAGVWQPLATALAANHTVVAPDLRGHGDSSKSTTGYDCDTILDDLTALMDHLGWHSAHIVGHSWSAKLACIWASRCPERFHHLVLIDPAFTGKFPEWTRIAFPLFYRVLPFLKMMGPFETYAAAETQAKALKQYKGWSQDQQQVFQDSIERKSDDSWGSKFCVAARDGVFEDFTQISGLTQSITVPTLFIRPTQGLNRSQSQLRAYERSIPQLKIESVPGNHWAFLMAPQTVNQTVTQFLSEF